MENSSISHQPKKTKAMLNQNDLFSRRWTELVFEGKNKAYGAFKIRESYERRMVIAMVSTFALFGLAIAAPALFAKQNDAGKEDIVVGPTVIDPTDRKQEDPIVELPKERAPGSASNEINFSEFIEISSSTNPDDYAQHGPDAIGIYYNPLGTGDGTSNELVDDSTATGDGGEVTDITGGETENEVILIPELWPEFPGGENAMIDWITEHVKYPRAAIEAGWKDLVYVNCVVQANGEVTNVQVLRGDFAVLNNAAVEGISKMPKWRPGQNNGVNVSVRMTIPVNFNLNQ